MKSLLFGFFVVAVGASGLVQGEDLSAEIVAARNFAFGGIAFGSSLGDFKKKFPRAEVLADESKQEIDLMVFKVPSTKGEAHDSVQYKFFEGKMIGFDVFYTPERLNKAGGLDPVFDRLKTKLGAPNDFGEAEAPLIGKIESVFWRLPQAERVFELRHSSQIAALKASDTAAEAQLVKKQSEKADLGF
jgi:hypothetical protein